jgi:hypothetical protein
MTLIRKKQTLKHRGTEEAEETLLPQICAMNADKKTKKLTTKDTKVAQRKDRSILLLISVYLC